MLAKELLVQIETILADDPEADVDVVGYYTIRVGSHYIEL